MNQLCPRPPVVKKKKQGQREKLATTVDKVLHDKIMELYEQGYSVSHIVDSALWQFFGKPTLSFEETNETDNG